jgi:sn-glycerol 3-phosphate transport system substrate-binding protein
MSKPRALVTFVLLLCLSLAACGGDKEAAPTGETSGAGPAVGTVTIDFWHSETAANLDTLERLVSQFNSSQDEVRVKLAYQGNNEELIAKLTASLGSSQVPAVALLVEADTQKMIDSGAVAPIQDFVDREDHDLSDLNETLVKFYSAQGRLWMMPFCAGVPFLYYNKVVFREVGLDPEKPPKDLEEIRQYSEKILKRDGAGNVVRSGIALDLVDWQERMVADHDELLVDNENGHDGRATKVLFDNDTLRWYFQWWHDMVDSGLGFNVGRNPTLADGLLAMASGRAAMTFSFSSALRSVIDALEKGVEGLEIGVSGLPGVPGGTGHPLLIERGLAIFNLRPEEEQQAAWKLVKWLMEPEQQAEWFAGSGYLPASHAALDLPASRDVVAQYPLFQVALDLYSSSPTTPAALGALLGPFWQVREALDTGVEAMLAGSKDPDQALKDAAEESNRIIADYNQRVGG